ncbi:MAG: hypothetical protein WAV28_04255 [Sedimentisphaerales bacterium]|jgi:hypothetical protein
MTAEETLEKRLEKLAQAIGPDETLIENVMSRIETKSIGESERIEKLSTKFIARRFIMNPFTKLAAAAVIIVAVVLSINFWSKTIPTAYAFEQTVEANHSVRYIHIKELASGHEDEPKEFWLEFNEDGQVKNVRMHMPSWDAPNDGAKVIVWKENKAQVWLKKKNALVTVRDKAVADQMLKFVEAFDPRLVVERLYKQEAEGKVKIEIDEPSNKAEPIVVTATSPSRRSVLSVDQATKLVTAIKFYQFKGGEYQYLSLMEFNGYNQPIEAKVFTLDDVPAEVVRIDQTTQEVGLAQGSLTDEEVAVEVVRKFFEALIAKDYARAGQLCEGVPADFIQKQFGQIKFLRIISVGPAAGHPNPETKGLVVPCTLEIEKDGEIIQWKRAGIGVRQVYNQPGRWTIFSAL